MKALKINNKTFNVPEGWSEVTFRNFIDLTLIKEDKYESDIDKYINSMSVLTDDPDAFIISVNDMDINDFTTVKDFFEWTNYQPEIQGAKEIIEIDGEKYTMKKEMNQLTMGEIVSLEMLLKNNTQNLLPLEIAFGVLFRKINPETNEIEKFNANSVNHLIRELSPKVGLLDVYGVLTFFLSGNITSTSIPTKDSSQEEKMLMMSSPSRIKEQSKSTQDSAVGLGIA
jgi:hypothetical protein